jgi:hypothetical protein
MVRTVHFAPKKISAEQVVNNQSCNCTLSMRRILRRPFFGIVRGFTARQHSWNTARSALRKLASREIDGGLRFGSCCIWLFKVHPVFLISRLNGTPALKPLLLVNRQSEEVFLKFLELNLCKLLWCDDLESLKTFLKERSRKQWNSAWQVHAGRCCQVKALVQRTCELQVQLRLIVFITDTRPARFS